MGNKSKEQKGKPGIISGVIDIPPSIPKINFELASITALPDGKVIVLFHNIHASMLNLNDGVIAEVGSRMMPVAELDTNIEQLKVLRDAFDDRIKLFEGKKR